MTARRHTTSRDMLATIALFESGRLSLPGFVDSSWVEIHDLAPLAPDKLGELEDIWTDLEIVYAMASAAGQSQLDDEQEKALESAIGQMEELILASG